MTRAAAAEKWNKRLRVGSGAIGAVLALALAAVVVRAFWLQVVEHRDWKARAEAQRRTRLQVPAYRGSIRDLSGKPLAVSIPQYSLCADGSKIDDPAATAKRLHPVLGADVHDLRDKLVSKRRFIWIKHYLSDRQASALRDLSLPGLYLIREYRRYYPYRQMAGQVLGFVGLDGKGLEGVERAYDEVLQQDVLSVGVRRDGGRKRLWRGESLPPSPEERSGLRTTLDLFVQYLSERELEAAVREWEAKSGQVIVLDARTSEVLALANWPFFDPNRFRRYNPAAWRNRAVTDAFEPGSAFKVFLAAALLETGTADPETRVFCEDGRFRYAGHTINDVHPHGWLTLTDMLRYSSNIGAAKLAEKLGAERYHRFIRDFGFGEETGIGLPGEASGILRPWRAWQNVDLASAAFGQGVGVTLVQLAAATNCIANDGIWRRPRILREIDGETGRLKAGRPDAGERRVIAPETARWVRDMMMAAAGEDGTGSASAPEGYRVAGKTGTAQVADSKAAGYAENLNTSVFTGFIPAENPRLVITVVIHEPKGRGFGGVVAAPVFCNIAAEALPYLGVFPSGGTARLAGNRVKTH
jgi:cell division protein FtsI (penicillin-binding protein 3)